MKNKSIYYTAGSNVVSTDEGLALLAAARRDLLLGGLSDDDHEALVAGVNEAARDPALRPGVVPAHPSSVHRWVRRLAARCAS